MSSTLIALAALAAAPALASTPLQVGQTRSCLSNGEGKQLFITVGRIEPFDQDHTAVSVSLFNEAPGAQVPGVAHAPIDSVVLETSCPNIATHSFPLSPEFEQGYGQWKDANGGLFTVTVDRIYDMAVSAMAKAGIRSADVH